MGSAIGAADADTLRVQAKLLRTVALEFAATCAMVDAHGPGALTDDYKETWRAAAKIILQDLERTRAAAYAGATPEQARVLGAIESALVFMQETLADPESADEAIAKALELGDLLDSKLRAEMDRRGMRAARTQARTQTSGDEPGRVGTDGRLPAALHARMG